MKKYLLSTGLLVALATPVWAQDLRKEIGNLVVDGVPALPAELLERVDQYQNVRGAGFADWDRDGKGLFISTRFADVPQIHYVAAPGADRRQITFFKEPLGAVRVAPDKKQNGFLSAATTAATKTTRSTSSTLAPASRGYSPMARAATICKAGTRRVPSWLSPATSATAPTWICICWISSPTPSPRCWPS